MWGKVDVWCVKTLVDIHKLLRRQLWNFIFLQGKVNIFLPTNENPHRTVWYLLRTFDWGLSKKTIFVGFFWSHFSEVRIILQCSVFLLEYWIRGRIFVDDIFNAINLQKKYLATYVLNFDSFWSNSLIRYRKNRPGLEFSLNISSQLTRC